MSRTPTTAPPVAVDVAVVLTAIVRPEPDVGGYSASIPALPGCHTQGETLDEVRQPPRGRRRMARWCSRRRSCPRCGEGIVVKVISGGRPRPLTRNFSPTL